jgi:hypothetical protein
MRSGSWWGALGVALGVVACSSSPVTTGSGGHGGGAQDAGADAGSDAPETRMEAGVDAGGGDSGDDGGDSGAPPADTLSSNRDRLLASYFAWLKANAPTPQSNGLSGPGVSSVCDLWQKLDPSAQAVFLTLTARMQGSVLGSDGSSMLWHVTRVYRISGGQGATATDPGSCGGGEYNRMIMSMDAELHAAQLAASAHQGAIQGNGKYDISDIPSGGFWRSSQDLGGAHAPFDTSDETNDGAPRAQTQFFADPASAAATSPLGRMDLTALVDPYALEMDQDYDCVHSSNPLCSYITYGKLCFPMTSALGTEIYQSNYGDFDPGWMPTGCP